MHTRALALLVSCCLVGSYTALNAGEALDLGNGVKIELSVVSAGTATLGSLPGEDGRGSDEDRRVVRISEDFLISSTPVTRGQFARFANSTVYRTEAEIGTSGGWGLSGGALVQRKDFTWRNPGFPQDDRHPVVLVTWADAQAFCGWASKLTRRSVTLPTEAEWEYAARGGNDGTWNGPATSANGGTRPVGEDPANPLGLHDLLGHVNQWCQDWYQPTLPADAVDPRTDHAPSGDTARRSLRGGSFLQITRQRVAARWRNSPGTRNADNGFRIVVRAAPAVAAAAAATTTSRPVPVLPEVEASAPVNPQPNQAPPPMPIVYHQRVDSGVSTFMVWFFFIFVGIVVVKIIMAVMKSVGSQDGGSHQVTQRQAPHQKPDLRDDGFWLDTRPYRRGARLRYKVRRDRAWAEEQIDITPDSPRQFIYTGLRPEEVVILGVTGGMAARSVRSERSARDDADLPQASTFGFPSAY
jgi:formylglycine-generating enzyme